MVYDKKEDFDGTSVKSYFEDKAVSDYTVVKYTGNTSLIIFKCNNGSVMTHEVRDNVLKEILD